MKTKKAARGKLGKISKQPPKSKFKLKRRMPGWRPDTLKSETEKLFPEEALYQDPTNARMAPFQPPFEEPPLFDPNDARSGAAWHDFHSWMVGSPLPSQPTNAFDKFLTEIARRVRNYNAAIYWMRRLHFHENAVPIGTPPDPNPNGDKVKGALPAKQTQDFKDLVSEAEAGWKSVVDDLNDLLAGREADYDFPLTTADMIEVNGYIVSMRIVSHEQTAAKEIGGSSSSHIYISSALSSSSP
jgi:hypothetical protein